MKYHALFVVFLNKGQNLKLSSAANYRWRFMGSITVLVKIVEIKLILPSRKYYMYKE